MLFLCSFNNQHDILCDEPCFDLLSYFDPFPPNLITRTTDMARTCHLNLISICPWLWSYDPKMWFHKKLHLLLHALFDFQPNLGRRISRSVATKVIGWIWPQSWPGVTEVKWSQNLWKLVKKSLPLQKLHSRVMSLAHMPVRIFRVPPVLGVKGH